jgi:hypothetical protein
MFTIHEPLLFQAKENFNLFLFSNDIPATAGAEPETIDRGCPVQINRIFGSKEILFFIIRPLFFNEPRECPGAGWHLPWIRPCQQASNLSLIGEVKNEGNLQDSDLSPFSHVFPFCFKIFKFSGRVPLSPL